MPPQYIMGPSFLMAVSRASEPPVTKAFTSWPDFLEVRGGGAGVGEGCYSILDPELGPQEKSCFVCKGLFKKGRGASSDLT